jgi:hypothetical protein
VDLPVVYGIYESGSLGVQRALKSPAARLVPLRFGCMSPVFTHNGARYPESSYHHQVFALAYFNVLQTPDSDAVSTDIEGGIIHNRLAGICGLYVCQFPI